MANEALIIRENRTLRTALGEEIDHHTAKGMRERIDKEIFKDCPEVLILDFSAVKFMDSSGIGLILGRCELCASLGIDVRIEGMSKTQKRLIYLSGIERVKNLTVV